MKLNMGQRILMLAHWLFSFLIFALLALCVFAPDFARGIYESLEKNLGPMGPKVLCGVLAFAYLVLSGFQLSLLVGRKRRSQRGFIGVDSGEAGGVRIAVSAVEQMVRQSVRDIDGIAEMKISIDGADEAIDIGVDATILSGAHVPTITSSMQRSIRQFVEVNCGVAVRQVSVSVNAVSQRPDTPRKGLLNRVRSKSASAAKPAPEVRDSLTGTQPSPAVAPVEEKKTDVGPHFSDSIPETEPSVPSQGAALEPEAATGFDPDKPYVSEFAKDLERMKAREAALDAATDAEGEDPSTDSWG